MILVKRKIRETVFTYLKLDDGKYVHLSEFVRFYDDVKNSYFEYENYDKEFLDKIFFAFRFECQSILNRKNSFKSGSLTHEYTINNRKKKEFLGKSDKYLNDLKVFNIVQKKLQKIKNA